MAWYVARHRRREARNRAALQASGTLGEPVSLHPVVDPARCMGSGACERACPERAIGVVDGRAQLIDAGACIGHGACAAACPHDAIRLVFGSETRGVQIPWVSPSFETSVAGVFVVGELGGMGLLRKAAQQGRQAIDAIAAAGRSALPLDVVIVGAGPAGLAASLAAKAKGLRFVTLEQERSLGGSILHYPRRKLAMTAPVELPLAGKVSWREVSKEVLLEFWQAIVRREALPVRFGERVERIDALERGFVLTTVAGRHVAANVVLALGRRGTPRKLDVPGEDLPKVVYRLLDPQQYAGRQVLVVGGGDSAIEAALAIAAEPQTVVTLSYRGEAAVRAKPRNRERLQEAVGAGRVHALWSSNVRRIEAHAAVMEQGERSFSLPNDAVIVCCGGTLPTELLASIGVRVETHRGTAPDARAA